MLVKLYVRGKVNRRRAMKGYAVEQLVGALRYRAEGHGFDFRWSHWDFSLT